MNLSPFLLLTCVAFILLACAPASKPYPPPIVVSVKTLGKVAAPPNVKARDGGNSIQMGDQMLWVFDDTLFTPAAEDGANLRSNTAALAPLADPLQTQEPVDSTGAPFQAIPFTAEELDYNRASGKSDERIALWPAGLLPEGNGSLVFVHKLYVHPGLLNYEHIGVELAEFAPGQTQATRLGALFGAHEPILVNPLQHDSYIYLYGMITIDSSRGIGVARVSTAQVRNRAAYQCWDGAAWVTDCGKIATLFNQVPGAVNVAWNEYLGRFVAVHSLTLSNAVVMRTAEHPEGPWSAPSELFTGEPPLQDVNYAGEQHPELAREQGRIIFVSYYHPLPAPLHGEIRLVQVDFK